MSRISLLRSARNRALLALALGVAATLVLPAIASAAESLYWSDFAVPEIRVASLGPGGSLAGSGPPQTLFAQPEATPPVKALGVAIDPAAAKIYWADAGSGTIEVANLNGSGSPQTLYEEPGGAAAYPAGVAIDPAAGKIYWADAYSDKIEVANLNGNGSPQTLFELPQGGEPWGVAIDPAAGKIYWAEYLGGRIEVGSVDGGTPETLVEEASAGPEALVVDPATRKIYWTNAESEEIEMSGIAGGSPETLVADGGFVPVGIALDPATGELYWSDVFSGEIASVNVDGKGAEAPLLEEAEGESPTFLALLSSPASTGTPVIAGGAGMIGGTLSCEAGNWAGDEPEAAFYEAPESIAYQWLDDGAPIAGATSATWTVSEGGSIACEATATNAAGSASARSASTSVPFPAPTVSSPTVSISSPASGEAFLLNEGVATQFSCTEGAGGPGLASCEDSNGVKSPSSGNDTGTLGTATLGAHTYTVTAVSKDGETGSATISYTVVPYAALETLPEVTIASLAKREKAGKVAVKLACSNAAACAGKLTLTAKVKAETKAGKRAKTAAKLKAQSQTLTLASASYRIAAGKSKTVELALKSSAVKVLQQAKETKLTVNLNATVKGGLAASVSQKLALSAKAKSGKKAASGKKGSSGKASKPGKKTAGKA